jgi:hypothetical protein
MARVAPVLEHTLSIVWLHDGNIEVDEVCIIWHSVRHGRLGVAYPVGVVASVAGCVLSINMLLVLLETVVI